MRQYLGHLRDPIGGQPGDHSWAPHQMAQGRSCPDAIRDLLGGELLDAAPHGVGQFGVGSGSQLIGNASAPLTIGENGTGALNIHQSGSVVNVAAPIKVGAMAGSVGTIDIRDGGHLVGNASAPLTIGDYGTGRLYINGFDSVVNIAAPIKVGAMAGSTGTIDVF